MDTDPLNDAPPARYAVESDSEDEAGFYPGPRPAREKRTYKVNVKTPTGGEAGLIVACGAIGAIWASGLEGNVVGDIVVDEVKIIEYKLTTAGILVATVSHRLPLGVQHTVAKAIVETQKNTKPTVVISSYSYLGYISSQPSRHDEYPIRFLQTSSTLKPKAQTIEPYAPPNLLQHLPAAVVAECEYLQRPATALLVPVRSISPPAPANPTLYSASDDAAPSVVLLKSAAEAVAAALETNLAQLGWDASRLDLNASAGKNRSRARQGDIGEGGMYM
ncbi:hypothetical protein BDV93DRAFT_156056 [Ceratobasidium sp. AG-I]|nr:hypothetical protein BDV93DRAFT_156056 [Ceratobasidium sp. AG-I]